MDVLELCERVGKENGYEVYEIDPAVMYPAVIEYMTDIVARDGRVSAPLQKFKTAATELNLGGVPIAIDGDVNALTAIVRKNRAAILETARLWFTRALKDEVGKPIGIRIKKDERYRL